MLLLLSPLFFQRTQGFSEKKIRAHHPYDARFECRFTVDVNPLFDQEYHYLGSGKECYAFESADGAYVIKFFKQKHMSLKPWQKALPFFFREKIERRNNLREKCFTSYMLALQDLAEETGTLYLHLNKTNHLNKKLKLYDNKKRAFTLNLDEVDFLVQKKATPILKAIEEYMSKKDIKKAKESIKSIVSLIQSRRGKEILDLDLNCERNLGLLNGKAISIDIGEFRKGRSKRSLKSEVTEATQDLKAWLESHYPELKEYLDKTIDDL